MKTIYICLILLLVSCTQMPTATQESLTSLREAFKVDKNCPHICWIGINPGTTTLEEALSILRNSDEVNQQSIQQMEYGFGLEWFIEPQKMAGPSVRLKVDNKNRLVQSILIIQLNPYTLKDIIDILGEPKEISITLQEGLHGQYIQYVLYHPSLNTFYYVNPNGKMSGPDPNDIIRDLYLNTNGDDKELRPWVISDYRNRQPWLGYGHLDEYLPGVEIPKDP